MMAQKTVQTIEDIARLANVSKSTVSRALNNSSLINQETRERIQAIAREHNFRLNAPARNLSLRQSHTIAYVTPSCIPEFCSMEDLFGLQIMGSIGEGLHDLGYDLLVVHGDLKDPSWASYYLSSGRVDGFILLISAQKDRLIHSLIDLDAPFIGWGQPGSDANYCSITGDNITGGKLATQHLIRTGRQQVAFLGGPDHDLTVQYRYKGYLNAMRAAGREIVHERVEYGDYSYESGTAAMQRLLKQSPDLDAVFVNSDLMAIAAINVLQASGKRVPEDVAVVGYDDLPIAYYNNLPLTTVRQNLPVAGKLLAQNLIQYIQTGVVTNVTLPVELVIRKSA
jgi:DNA-binding LacI/PurR family transcriptional regulator